MISGSLRDPAREPIQDLYELKLIVKVVFKPQDYLFVVVETGDSSLRANETSESGTSRNSARNRSRIRLNSWSDKPPGTGPSCRMSSQQTTWPGSPVWGIETDSPLVMWSIANKAANREIAQAGA